MKFVYKYELQISDEQTLMLKGPVLSVGIQGGNIMIWAIHDDEVMARRMRIMVRGTGHQLNGAEQGFFIGTVFLDSLVFHVFGAGS